MMTVQNKIQSTTVLAFVLALLVMGCGAPETTHTDEVVYATAKRAVEWGPSDNPSLLSADFEYRFSALPTSGAAEQTPWTGTYWPTYRDNINYRWDGPNSDSPAKKFEKAFGRTGLEDRISKEFGIDSAPKYGLDSCTKNSECDDDMGELCSKRADAKEGYCVPSWWGICHAWAPAAILEKEPDHGVDYNGVSFKVNDLKALISLSYTAGVATDFISLRCNKSDKKEEITYDENGIPVDADKECADTNAGTFHVVVTNMLGIQGRSFVEDRTFDDQVWNQPVRSYEMTKNTWVSAQKANELVGMTDAPSVYQFNDKAESFRHIKMTFKYITESPQHKDGNLNHIIDYYTHSDHYEYVLELDGTGKIIGGEWVGESKKDHPDFLWVPTSKKSMEVAKDEDFTAGTGIAWDDVKLLLEAAYDTPETTPETGGFDWGTACEAGSGTFNQPIAKDGKVEVGEIPPSRHGVYIKLTSDEDVDIQLIDKETGFELIAWPSGKLNGHDEACTTHEGVEYCWSGYNGDGTNYGHEWIEIKGASNRTMIMKAFGYKAGTAVVDYSWDAPPAGECVDAGSGTFTQDIAKGTTTDVGVIPAGKVNVKVSLTCETDVDIQIYDGDKAIVMWPSGILSGSSKQYTEYEGMTVIYSGYNGDGTNLGHEYIVIQGTLTKDLTMKAYGYKAGDAQVDYFWGLSDEEMAPYAVETETESSTDDDDDEGGNFWDDWF